MEENINVEEEVLESNVLPEELKKYLDKDTEVIEKLDGVIVSLDSDIELLNNQKDATEKEFEDRLNEFKEKLAKEKEDAFDEFSRKEQDILDKKAKIENLKLEQQGKQVNFIDALKDISSKCNSKISSIEDAIKACEDNSTLNKALEEEKNKMEELLNDEYGKRKEELNNVLVEIGEQREEEPSEVDEYTQSFELPNYEEDYEEETNYDDNYEDNYVVPEEEVNNYVPEDIPTEDNFNIINEEYDNEVVSHETRKDVIDVIYESEDVMEGHVFPYLKSLM